MTLSRVRQIQYLDVIVRCSKQLIDDLHESGVNITRLDARLVIADLLAYIGADDESIRAAVGEETWYKIAGLGGIELTTQQAPQ